MKDLNIKNERNNNKSKDDYNPFSCFCCGYSEPQKKNKLGKIYCSKHQIYINPYTWQCGNFK